MKNGIRIRGSVFWVVHRSSAYGPFDYEWSSDFCGVEFHFQGEKFGEYCSADEVYADLKTFRLPRRVCEVASIAIGTLVRSIFEGLPEDERPARLKQTLTELGFPRFAHVATVPTEAA